MYFLNAIIIASPDESKVYCNYFLSAALTQSVYRNCLYKHCGPVDQKALERSIISHQVVYQAYIITYCLCVVVTGCPGESKVDVISFDPRYWSCQSTVTFSMGIVAQWISSLVYYTFLIYYHLCKLQ